VLPTVIKAGDPRRAKDTKEQKQPTFVPEGLLQKLRNLQWVNLRRLKESQQYSVELPDESSYLLKPEALHWVLESLGFLRPESVLDYVWNFREAALNLDTGQVTCTYERNRRIGRPR